MLRQTDRAAEKKKKKKKKTQPKQGKPTHQFSLLFCFAFSILLGQGRKPITVHHPMLPSVLLILVDAHSHNYSSTHKLFLKMLKTPNLKVIVFACLCVYDLRLLVEEAKAFGGGRRTWWGLWLPLFLGNALFVSSENARGGLVEGI